MKETYLEPAGRLEVYERCDVLVVGSGAAGHSAAVAAARGGVQLTEEGMAAVCALLL